MGCSEHHEPFHPPKNGPRAFCVLTTLAAEGQDEVEELAAMLEILVQDNERWILRMLEMGVVPPCCSKCGGVKYREPSAQDYEAGAVLFECAPAMFEKHIAACGTIAAYDAAAMRQLEDAHAWVEVVDGGGGPSSWHAIVGTPAGPHDPTLEMERG